MNPYVWKINLAALATATIPASPLVYLEVQAGYWYVPLVVLALYLVFTAWMARGYGR